MFTRFFRPRPEGGATGGDGASATDTTGAAASAAATAAANAGAGDAGAPAGDAAAAAAAGAADAGATVPAGDAAAAAAGEDAGKPADKVEPAPVTYTLALPEKSLLDAGAIERTVAIASARGLSNEAAQEVLNLASQEVASQREAFMAAYQPGGAEWAKQETAWRGAALADPEIGNNKPEQFEARVALSKRAFDKFASDGFKTFLETTGFGSHPEVVRVFSKIGEAMGEAGVIVSGSPPINGSRAEDRLYPSMQKEQAQ